MAPERKTPRFPCWGIAHDDPSPAYLGIIYDDGRDGITVYTAETDADALPMPTIEAAVEYLMTTRDRPFFGAILGTYYARPDSDAYRRQVEEYGSRYTIR